MTTSLKLTLLSLSVATVLLACTASTSTDDVDVDVEGSTLETKACSKLGCSSPPPGGGGGRGEVDPGPACEAPRGGPRPVPYPGTGVFDPYPERPTSTSTTSSPLSGAVVSGVFSGTAVADPSPSASSGSVQGNVVVDWRDLEVAPPEPVATLKCEGVDENGLVRKLAPGPDGTLVCWTGCVPKVDGGIPQGFTYISYFVCPPAYVNKCEPFYNTCSCWPKP